MNDVQQVISEGDNLIASTPVPPSRVVPSMADDVRAGLAHRPRELHPKYFYDERGSALFDQICDTPEYYPTRTEDALLRQYAAEIIAAAGPHSMLELGSGMSRKTRHLLAAWDEPGGIYWPFDVSGEMLVRVAEGLAGEFPSLRIHPLIGDYTAGFGHFPDLEGRTLAMFLGSTLGNFAPDFAAHFLADFVTHLDRGDSFLLGADLVKDPGVIEAAYNDRQGITAEFNLNVLRVINRVLAADFDLDAFTHRAIYNRREQQIEMYLDSRRAQTVRIGALGMEIELAAGEPILTEISRKFTLEQVRDLFAGAQLTLDRVWTSESHPYALALGRR